MKTISGRYLDIGVGLIFQRRWGFLMTAEDDLRTILGYRCGPYISKALGFSLCWTLYTSCVEDDLRTILGIGVGLIFQRRWDFLIDC